MQWQAGSLPHDSNDNPQAEHARSALWRLQRLTVPIFLRGRIRDVVRQCRVAQSAHAVGVEVKRYDADRVRDICRLHQRQHIHIHDQSMLSTTNKDASQWWHVAVIAAPCESHMIRGTDSIVRRIDTQPHTVSAVGG